MSDKVDNLNVEGAKQVVPLVTQYIHDLADMLVGYVEVGDAEGAVSCLMRIEEAVSPGASDDASSSLARAYVVAVAGGFGGLVQMLGGTKEVAPVVERRQELRRALANAIGLSLEDVA